VVVGPLRRLIAALAAIAAASLASPDLLRQIISRTALFILLPLLILARCLVVWISGFSAKSCSARAALGISTSFRGCPSTHNVGERPDDLGLQYRDRSSESASIEQRFDLWLVSQLRPAVRNRIVAHRIHPNCFAQTDVVDPSTPLGRRLCR
jgi:hypothetical protein